MVYICTKFHENILNGIRLMKRTRKVKGRTDGRPDGRTDRQTNGRTDEGHDIVRPVFDGRIKKLNELCKKFLLYLIYPKVEHLLTGNAQESFRHRNRQFLAALLE